jgi:hypothetical protein
VPQRPRRRRLPDDDETRIGTDPNNPDTDGDGIRDGDEVGPDRTMPRATRTWTG